MTGWSRASAIWGGLVWLVLLVVLPLRTDEAALIERLLLLAILVFTPLALSLAATPDRAGRHPRSYRAAQSLQPFAAALAVVSFLLPAGIPAALFTLGWFSFTGLVALFGLVRFLPRGIARADETCIDAALLYLPVGGVWLCLSRLGANPLGFSDTIVLLTAVHFHYAGFTLPILVGMTGRALAEIRPSMWKAFRLVAAGVIAGPAFVAAGITFSPLIEVIAAVILATSLIILSLLTLFVIVPGIHGHLARGLLFISAAALIVGMLFASVYAVGEFTGTTVLSIPHMAQIHGLVNALGFVLCSLLAWSILRPESHLPAPETQPGSAM